MINIKKTGYFTYKERFYDTGDEITVVVEVVEAFECWYRFIDVHRSIGFIPYLKNAQGYLQNHNVSLEPFMKKFDLNIPNRKGNTAYQFLNSKGVEIFLDMALTNESSVKRVFNQWKIIIQQKYTSEKGVYSFIYDIRNHGRTATV